MELPTFEPPQWMQDQMKAAGDQLASNVHAVVDAGKMKWSSPDCRYKAEAKTAETKAAVLNGTIRICRHLSKRRGAARIATIVIQLAHTDTLMCGECAIAYQALIQDTEEDGTCDFCRKHVDLLWPIMFTYAYYVYMGGGCDACWPQTMTMVDGDTNFGSR